MANLVAMVINGKPLSPALKSPRACAICQVCFESEWDLVESMYSLKHIDLFINTFSN